jgi:hypothetical protein
MLNSEVYKLFSEVMDHMIKYYSGQIDQNKWQERIGYGIEGRDKFFEVIKNTPRLIKENKKQVLNPINSSQCDEQIKIHVKNIFNDQEIFTVMCNKYFDLQVFKYFNLLMKEVFQYYNLLMKEEQEIVGALLKKMLSRRTFRGFTDQETILKNSFKEGIKKN